MNQKPKTKKSIAVIPARGGSKRIPRKNIKEFCGKPIIAYSIEAALQGGLFDRVIVSTDDQEISEVAKSYGAEIPFMRPPELSDDYAGTDEVFLHALEYYLSKGQSYEYACCIYATAPFIQSKFLQQGLELLKTGAADSAFSVTSYPYPLQRSVRVNEEGFVEMFWPEYRMSRSQDLPEAWHDAGQFYWVRCDTYLQQRRIWGARTKAVVLPRRLVQDIDTIEDWDIAELMYSILRR